MRRLAVSALLASLLLPLAGDRRAAAGGEERQRGMSYAHVVRRAEQRGYGSPASADSLQRLRELGVTWVSLTPFGFQRTPRDRDIRWGGSRLSETDDRVRAAADQARAVGIRVMMKPHLWLRPPAWVGEIEHEADADWTVWFAAYRAFILHYARLAAASGMDSLCIGNELDRTVHREADWRAIIREIRAVYAGPLTYGASVSSARDVPFWDALDYIGISAYYPLVDAVTPTRDALAAAWRPIVADLAALSARWGKPVLFTELGYRSADFGAWRHWEVGRDAPANLEVQANAYAAFFDTIWAQPWFAGVYWWKWMSHLDDGGPDDNDFTPRDKPAERVLAARFLEPASR